MYTYIIESQGLYKIGRAKNVEKRINQYRTHNPLFKVVKVINGDYERLLHKIFWDKRSHLEWYNLTQEEILTIEDRIQRDEKEDKLNELRRNLPDNIEENVNYVSVPKIKGLSDIVLNMSAGGLTMYTYILHYAKSNTIEILPKDYIAKARTSSMKSYTRAVNELIDAKYIYLSPFKYTYYINPGRIYCGSRILKYPNNLQLVGKFKGTDQKKKKDNHTNEEWVKANEPK